MRSDRGRSKEEEEEEAEKRKVKPALQKSTIVKVLYIRKRKADVLITDCTEHKQMLRESMCNICGFIKTDY